MGNKVIDESKESESEYKWFIKKLPESPGIILTEKNTSLTADMNNIYISSNIITIIINMDTYKKKSFDVKKEKKKSFRIKFIIT